MLIYRLTFALALLLVPAVASADGHRAGGFGGGGFQKSNPTGMFHFGFDYVPKGLDRLPLAFEMSLTKGNTDEDANKFKTYAFGTYLPIPVGSTDHAFAVRALIGGTFDKQLTSVVGISWDWVKNRRTLGLQYGATVKLDGIFIDDTPKHMRFSVGFVMRYKDS